MTTDHRIGMTIEIQATGDEKLRTVADEVRKLGEGAGRAQPQFNALADEIEGLAAQQGAIDSFRTLKRETTDLGNQLNQATTRVDALAQELEQARTASGNAAASEKKLTAEYERTVRLAGSLSTAYGAKNRALEAARAETQKLGISTQQLQQSQEQVNTSVQRSKDALQQLTQRYTGLGRQAQDAGNQAQGAHRKIGEGVQSISTQLSNLQKAMGGLFAAGKLLGYAKESIAVADAYGQMAERIQMVTSDQQEYELVQQRLLESANTTYRALAEQQELYISTADTLRSLGYQTEQVLDITDSFTYLLTTNAASAEKGRNAIDAYTKSIMSGRVEVDSWQTIMAAMPTVVDAIAQATGKSAEQIRQLGITGKLSVQDLNEGLRQSMQANQEAVAGMSATVADAMTRLANTWSAYIGSANQASQTTQRMAGMVDLLSDNLDAVVSAATSAGSVMVAVWGVKALNAVQGYAAQLAAATTQTSALMAGTTTAGAKMATALAAAGKLAAAGWIGWQIGTYLRSEFEVVERAGIHMAEVLHKAAVFAQAGWEMIKAAFTDDTIAAAIERMNAQLREVDTGYAELRASVGQTQEAQQKNTQATQEASAALEKHRAVVLDQQLGLAAYSAQVEELEQRWQAAAGHLEQVRAALAQGTATALEAQVAQIQLNAAKRDYAQALEGLGQKLEAHHALEKADLDLQSAAVRLAVEKQRSIYEVAKARGDEAGATRAMNEIRKLEIQLMEITAQAKRAEAQAALALLETKRAELTASGEYTGLKKLEIDAQIKAAQAKQVEAQIADVTAKKLRELAWVQEHLGNSTQKTTGHIHKQTQALQGLEKAAEKAAQQVSAAEGGGSFTSAAHARQAKDVQELDAWWEEFLAEYRRKNKFNTSSTGFDDFWIKTQEAQYQNARRELEAEARIQEKAQAARGGAGVPAAPTPTPATPQASTPGANRSGIGARQGGSTYTSNIFLPNQSTPTRLEFADEGSQAAAENLLRQLFTAKGRAA